jgi:STE24 endopeptidase
MNEDKASRYHRLSRRATLVWAAAGTGALASLLLGGSRILRDLAIAMTEAGPSAPSTVALYALALVLGYHALRLPLAFYQGFVLERRYGLSSESLRAWLLDYLRAALLMVVLAVAAAEIIYVTMWLWPGWWWAATGAVFAGLLLVLARVAPVALLPLFYRFEPLDREALRARLVALSERARLPVLGVYVWGLGQKTRRANAALIGTGPTRRILLSDTLLADYSDDEIEVILAHEMAHHAHGDIRRGLMIESILIAATMALGATLLDRVWPSFGLTGPADVAGLPLLFLTAVVVSMSAAPILNALSRHNERRADGYALNLTGRPEAFVSAMRRLAAQNLAEERPSRLTLWFFHSHPPIEERIERARQLTGR